ncbi:hypothetical protein [Elioraea sp.]|uniref:hypothetical protein n=1 Tax=Elioraea sp. TaxID=2185103 RepID=UPI003F72BB01
MTFGKRERGSGRDSTMATRDTPWIEALLSGSRESSASHAESWTRPRRPPDLSRAAYRAGVLAVLVVATLLPVAALLAERAIP